MNSHVHGYVVDYKASLIAKGFTQRESIDCHETFSIVENS